MYDFYYPILQLFVILFSVFFTICIWLVLKTCNQVLATVIIWLHRSVWNLFRLPKHTYPPVETFQGMPTLLVTGLLGFLLYACFADIQLAVVLTVTLFLLYFYRKIIIYILKKIAIKLSRKVKKHPSYNDFANDTINDTIDVPYTTLERRYQLPPYRSSDEQ